MTAAVLAAIGLLRDAAATIAEIDSAKPSPGIQQVKNERAANTMAAWEAFGAAAGASM
jgi:indole-3-glycerol phosphate synthase